MTQESSTLDLADLLQQVRHWCQMHLAAGDLAQAEAIAQQVSQAVAATVWEAGVAQCSTQAGYVGTQQACPCGQSARFVGYRSRWVRGRWGEVQVTRAYYHCASCHRGTTPWDQQQGLNERVWTPAVKALVAELCAHLPYREVGSLLARHWELDLAESSLEDLVAEVGGRLRAAEAAQIHRCFELLDPPEAILPADKSDNSSPATRLYIGIDAAKAHTDGSWHDVKCATLYSGAPRATPTDPAGSPAGDRAGSQRYVARQETAAAFGPRLYVAALQAGLTQAAEVVVLGDGAEWIWKLAAEQFQGATEILDYWHACEHLWKLVPVLYGEQSETGRRWAEHRCRELQEQGPNGLLRALRRRKGKDASQQEALRLALQYFTAHRRRLQYPEFRRRGLMIGSGPVEAACKSIVGQRLKGTGMRWSAAGADAILALRTTVLSGRTSELLSYAHAA